MIYDLATPGGRANFAAALNPSQETPMTLDDDAPLYHVVAIDGRGNVREYEADDIESRDAAYALKSRIEYAHPNWTVRVRVWPGAV